jgi:cardiolipin synthase
MDGLVLQEEEVVVVPRDRGQAPEAHSQEDHTHDIYTVANIITVLRLILIPIFFSVMISGRSDVVAFLLFATAASTDWLDGQIARRTGTVTELGKAIDPLVDRLLIASGVLGVYLERRVPLWVVIVLLARDAWLLFGASLLARRRRPRVPVNFLGKTATALLLFGFAILILGWPRIPGAGLVDTALLPGLGTRSAVAGIWFIYGGIIASLATAATYTVVAARSLNAKRSASSSPAGEDGP